jgi:hypothetical protein
MRLVNGRRQMLLRDEFANNGAATQWRMQCASYPYVSW